MQIASNPTRGFSLTEVLAGMIVFAAFMLGVFPIVTLSAVEVSKSQRSSEAANLIRQDLDYLHAEAAEFDDCLQPQPFADSFRTMVVATLPAPLNSATYTSGEYTITRTMPATATIADDLLEVSYQATHTNSGDILVDDLTSKVIPAAVYLCQP